MKVNSDSNQSLEVSVSPVLVEAMLRQNISKFEASHGVSYHAGDSMINLRPTKISAQRSKMLKGT